MQKVIEVHTEEFGSQPEIVVQSPSRFDLLGEYSCFFGDEVLSMAIDLPVYVAFSRRTDNILRFYYNQTKERKKIPLSITKYRKEDKMANIVKSILHGYADLGFSFSGFDITFYSELLPSVGFGIEPAFKVAVAFAIKKLYKIRGNDSLLKQVIEKGDKQFFYSDFFVSDVNSVLFSKKKSCVLTNYSSSSHEVIPFKFEGLTIVLTDSKVPIATLWNKDSLYTEQNKKLLHSLKTERKSRCVYEESISEINEILSDVSEDIRRKLICIMKENQILLDTIESLKNNNLSGFARGINRSHELMRDSFMISCPEIDWLVKRVQEIEQNSLLNLSSCSRIIAKDYSYCTYSIMKDEYVETYMQKLQDYERIFGFHPTTYIVHPSDGISVIKDTGV